MTQIYLITALLIAGCSSFKESSDTSTPFVPVDHTYEDGDPEHEGLPDLTDGIDEGGCEEFNNTSIAGFTGYFYGLYTKSSGGNWNGYEEWIHFANETWQEDGGEDCTIRWDVTAVEVDPVSCVDCDLGLSVTFFLDESGSTCPEDMVEVWPDTSSELYDVMIDSDGDTAWYFSSSFESVGEGHANDDAMNFLTPKSCYWL